MILVFGGTSTVNCSAVYNWLFLCAKNNTVLFVPCPLSHIKREGCLCVCVCVWTCNVLCSGRWVSSCMIVCGTRETLHSFDILGFIFQVLACWMKEMAVFATSINFFLRVLTTDFNKLTICLCKKVPYI